MLTYYGTEISPNQTKTDEGFLICKNVPIARTGTMEYLARELGLDGDPERIVTVNRYEEDVFSPAAMASFEGKIVTDNHPPDNLLPETAGAYSRGHVQNVRREGDKLVADLHITDASLISDIANGVKREVSCGYTCIYVPDGNGYRQTQIRGNHVAVVPAGRAGHEVAIKDKQPEKGVNRMNKFRTEILKLFGSAAKDANPEELEKMVETTATALDAEVAPAPATEPEKKTEEQPKETEDGMQGGDLGAKLDKLIEMMGAFMENQMDKKKMSDESDIDKEIERLIGKAPAVEPEKAVTISAEEMEDKKCTAGDAFTAELLKKIRPDVAAIENKEDRARVVDAVLSTIRSGNMGADILAATQDSAKKASSQRKDMSTICAEQKAAYDKFNPHKNKQ